MARPLSPLRSPPATRVVWGLGSQRHSLSASDSIVASVSCSVITCHSHPHGRFAAVKIFPCWSCRSSPALSPCVSRVARIAALDWGGGDMTGKGVGWLSGRGGGGELLKTGNKQDWWSCRSTGVEGYRKSILMSHGIIKISTKCPSRSTKLKTKERILQELNITTWKKIWKSRKLQEHFLYTRMTNKGWLDVRWIMLLSPMRECRLSWKQIFH